LAKSAVRQSACYIISQIRLLCMQVPIHPEGLWLDEL
jgi:hypothetical protein